MGEKYSTKKKKKENALPSVCDWINKQLLKNPQK